MKQLPEDKTYLIELIENLEKQYRKDERMPFKIEALKEKGITVKVGGLFAYVPFHKMPWSYNNFESWKAIFPGLVKKVFFCKIHKIQRDPLFILIDAAIPQFKKPQLDEGRKYHGIVIQKAKYGLFVDIGFHFNWKFGSLPGLIHITNLEKRNLSIEDIELGQEIETTYYGKDEKGKLILDNPDHAEWFKGKLKDLIGKKERVEVKREGQNPPQFFVRSKYDAVIPVTTLIYPDNKEEIKRAKNNLKDGDTICCEVLGINKNRKVIKLKWLVEHPVLED